MSDEKQSPARKPLEIIDNGEAPVRFVDVIMTGNMREGVADVTLGTHDPPLEDKDGGRVVVAARLRFSRDFAARLHQGLGVLLEGRTEEGDGTLTMPPSSTIN